MTMILGNIGLTGNSFDKCSEDTAQKVRFSV